jgi:hypothetical protein
MYEKFTRNKFEEFLYQIGLDDDYVHSIYEGWNKEKLMFEVLKYFNQYPDEGEPFIYTILKEFITIYKKRSNEEEYNILIRVLLEDGIHIEGTSVETVAGEIAEPAKEENNLFTKLKELNFKSVIRFLEQSYQNYIHGNYEASNAMTRTSLEELVKLIATDISQARKDVIPISSKRANKPQPVDYRNYLKKVNFLNGKEFALLEAFYQFGSTKGAHPGLSDTSDCRLRRFMLVGLCLQYLEKYKNFP